MTQEQILQCHGLPSETEWSSLERSTIWDDYDEELKTSSNKEAALQRSFNAFFTSESSIDQGMVIAPVLSRNTARDLKTGTLAPMHGLLTYENCDTGLMPLGFTERSAEEIVNEQQEDDEYQGVTFRTVETEKARGSRHREKKAPNQFLKSQQLLQTYATVIKGHFTESSPLYRALVLIYKSFTYHRSLWYPDVCFTEIIGARFWWLISRMCYNFISKMAWNSYGTAPICDATFIIPAIQTGSLPAISGMPTQLIDYRDRYYNTPKVPPGYGGNNGLPTPDLAPSGGGIAQNGEHLNNQVPEKISAMIKPALDKLGKTAKFGTILQISNGLGVSVRYEDTILDPAHCQEFLTVGRCARAGCKRSHNVGYEPTEERLTNFLSKMEPAIGAIIHATKQDLDKARRKRRRT